MCRQRGCAFRGRPRVGMDTGPIQLLFADTSLFAFKLRTAGEPEEPHYYNKSSKLAALTEAQQWEDILTKINYKHLHDIKAWSTTTRKTKTTNTDAAARVGVGNSSTTSRTSNTNKHVFQLAANFILGWSCANYQRFLAHRSKIITIIATFGVWSRW